MKEVHQMQCMDKSMCKPFSHLGQGDKWITKWFFLKRTLLHKKEAGAQRRKMQSHLPPLPLLRFLLGLLYLKRLTLTNFSPKKGGNFKDILEVFKQVQINIPFLDDIQQVPSYAKFLKDLITVKRKTNVRKKICLTEQVCSILQCRLPIKYKDPGCPTISCTIGVSHIEKALLDLGASVNLLPYSVYLQLGLGELKPTSMTLQLADRSVKIPRGIVEDVLIKVDKFYFPMDFIVLDTEPVQNIGVQIPVTLGRPFLATANDLINCRTGVMKISFGNMTVELNIFDISKKPRECDEIGSACLIEEIIDEVIEESSTEDPLEACIAQFGEDLNLDMLLEQANAILEFAPLESNEKEEAAVPEPPKKELKPLPDNSSISSSVQQKLCL
jgi:hypothetical protein